MDNQVLEAISERLYTVTYPFANTHIIPEKEQLKMMFFVVRGEVTIKSDSTIKGPKTCQMGGFYGEELAYWVTTWVSHSSFPAKLPLPTGSALSEPRGTVEILALSADDLKSVLSKFRSNFTRESTLLTYSQSEPLTRDPLTCVQQTMICRKVEYLLTYIHLFYFNRLYDILLIIFLILSLCFNKHGIQS